MNFVKGVTGFLRRSSASHETHGSKPPSVASSDSSSDPPAAPSWADIQFSENDAVENLLGQLWQEYRNASPLEKNHACSMFLLKFNGAYQGWAPLEQHREQQENAVVCGCHFGHPTQVVSGLVHELKSTSERIAELHASSDSGEPSLDADEMEASTALLTTVDIVTRAQHNRIVFSYFGGLQISTGLMKNCIVYMKGISGTVPQNMEVYSFLQCLLGHIVSIMASFIAVEEQSDKPLRVSEEAPSISSRERRSSGGGTAANFALLLETGGLNWFVELLRVLRKLRLRGVDTDESLENLVLQTLKAAIAASSRAQNHFRSIGGLDVLLDGLGCFPSISSVTDESTFGRVMEDFNIQMLSLEVVKEAVFRNVNSLQSLREMNGVQKFIELFRWAAFSFPGLFIRVSGDATTSSLTNTGLGERFKESDLIYLGVDNSIQPWDTSVSRLSNVLCSFLFAAGDMSSVGGPQDITAATAGYWENGTRLVVNVLLGVFRDADDTDGLKQFRILSSTLQRNILGVFKKMLAVSPSVLKTFRDESVWTVLFSKFFFYYGLKGSESIETQPLQLEVVSFTELAASVNGNTNNLAECSALVQALEQCTQLPSLATMLLKSLHRILQLAPESTSFSFKQLEVIVVLSEVMAMQLQTLRKGVSNVNELVQCRDAAFLLFNGCLSVLEDAQSVALRSMKLMDVLFSLVSDPQSRSFAIHHISNFMKLSPSSEEDQDAKMELCMKYLETLSRVQADQRFASIHAVLDLLSMLRDVLQNDFPYYQALFRDVECFVHIVSLLNESYPEEDAKKLCLEVNATLIYLLKGNEASKLVFRSLVGPGYKMLETLLLDRYGHPTESLISSLFDMIVDDKFNIPGRMIIQNDDVVILLFNIIRQCDRETQMKVLNVFLLTLEESSANQSSCVRAGLLSFLLDWFSSEEDELVLRKVSQFMKLVGGHSMAGKEMRRIFYLLQDTMSNSKSKNSLLLSTFKSMFSEQGPSVFFELTGKESGIVITTPLRWPTNKGFSFMCWLRIESLTPENTMGLFSFLTENGKGYTTLLSSSSLRIEVESNNHKRLSMSMRLTMESKKWHHICVTHSTGRALTTGSVCKIYVDGQLIGNEKMRYPKVYDPLTRCSIGASVPYTVGEDQIFSTSLCGQLGPIYLFDDVLTATQVQGVFMLGAGYMYSFLPSEVGSIPANMPDDSLFGPKDGLSLKMVFGYNALASTKRNLFDVAPVSEHPSDAVTHEATIMAGTQLCYRCLVQNNIQCVGGITVFFPLLTRLQQPLVPIEEGFARVVTDADDYYLVDVIELLAAVVAKNYANQKVLLSSGGLPLLGFLLQFVSIKQLSVKVISAINTLLVTLAESSDRTLSDILVKEIILKIYLNTSAWIFSPYVIQRELYLSLINFLEMRSCENVFTLSRFLDIIHHFYWDKPKSRRTLKGIYVPGERPWQEHLAQLRILILSLAEGTIRQRLTLSDMKSLISFVDRSDDIICVEEVLQMLLGLLGDAAFLSSFLENMHVLNGVQAFLNLLKRPQITIRMVALHIIGVLFVPSPADRKSNRMFGIGDFKYRASSILFCVTERLLLFPLTDELRITLFDILLGASMPKQILLGGILAQFGKNPEKRAWITQLQALGNPAHTSTFPQFQFPGVLRIILKFVENSDYWTMRQDILRDILGMLEVNPLNCDLLVQESSWHDWFFSILASASTKRQQEPGAVKRWTEEVLLIRRILCMVHAHAVFNMKGGWRQVERTVSYVQMFTEQDLSARQNLMYDLLDDVIDSILKSRSPQTSLTSQPCRDNVLYLVSLVEELIVTDTLQFLPKSEDSEDNSLLSGSYVDLGSETRRDEEEKAVTDKDRKVHSKISYYEGFVFYQRLYDNIWTLLSCINGTGQGSLPVTPAGPSFGQRARGLVESLNIPAAEVAAAVTGGLGSVGINVSSKPIEKAMKLRGEKFSRIAFRLVVLCLYKGDLETALSSVQHFLPLVPSFLSAESDQNRGQLQLLLWSLLDARKQMVSMDDGARYHVVSQLIQELLEVGKSSLATSIVDKEKSLEENDGSSVYGLLQHDKVIALVRDDKKFSRSCRQQWASAANAVFEELKEVRKLELREVKALEEQFQSSMLAVHTAELSRRAASQLKHEADEQAVASQWCLLFRNLTDERGPWSSGVFPSPTPVWWKLDKTEDPLRRRMKLKRNYHFDRKLLQPPDASTQSSSSESVAKIISTGKKIGLRTTLSFTDKYAEDDEMHDANEEFDNENTTDPGTNDDDGTESKQGPAEDEVLLSVSCVLVSTKHKLAGRLEVTNASLHFHMEFVIEGTGGSLTFDPSGGFNPQIVNDHCKSDGRSNIMKQHRQWDLLQVTAIYATRYLLHPTALEIFFADAAPPVFFNFQSHQVAKDVALKLVATRTIPGKGKSSGKDKDRNQIHYVDRKKAVELAEKAKECWRRRECSNFDYLMILNTLACRSYNDLTQYPVFPWILGDYTSETLDLNDRSVFRDLSKPVGALDEKRLKVFQERYDSFNDPDIPSFHYGSHYSSMGIVLFYLLRLEPFSYLHRILQGGKFDHADRLFHSIQNTYANCLTNTSDVKEIIPEFFYMPEFLTNTNNYYIGVKQDGQALDNVNLPPWAKGSPEEFIRLNREALESEHTSDNLHHWIDLIFGYKQRGRPAVEAANVFYYLTYEGAVDLDSITDSRQRASIEDQIANFGQTPIQLFRKKHPKRGPFIPLLRPLYYSPASIVLITAIASKQLSPSAEDSPVLYIGHIDGNIVSVTSQMLVSVRTWLTPSAQAGGSFTFSSAQDMTFGLGSETWPSHKIRGYFAETFTPDSSCFCLLQANGSTYLLTCGHWDNSFKLMSLADGHTAQSNCQHKDVVTCVSAAVDGSVVVTGSRDTTVMVWEVRRRTDKLQKQELIISDKPRHVLCGHDDLITAVVVRTELDLVVSGSKDGSCILHTLRQGRYVRSLVHPSRKPISLLAVSQHGLIALFSNEDLCLHLCSVNGKWLAESELNGRLSCLQLSSCGEFLLCGGDQGHVIVRKMQSLEMVYRYEGTGSPICSLCVTPEDCFIASTRDSKLLVYAVDTTIRNKGSR